MAKRQMLANFQSMLEFPIIAQYQMAVSARDTLREAGAKLEFAEYEGGHGWHGNVFGNLRTGIDWADGHRLAGSAGGGLIARSRRSRAVGAKPSDIQYQ